MKIDAEYLEFMWPMRHYLITCGKPQEKANIIAVSFCMPVSKEPPLIACAIGRSACSCKLIESNKEFVVNVPTKALEAKVYYCGFHTGYEVDKFKETGLTAKPARMVNTVIIDECVAHMECRLIKEVEAGDKNLLIGEVIEAYADEAAVQDKGKIKFGMGDFPRKVYGIRLKT